VVQKGTTKTCSQNRVRVDFACPFRVGGRVSFCAARCHSSMPSWSRQFRPTTATCTTQPNQSKARPLLVGAFPRPRPPAGRSRNGLPCPPGLPSCHCSCSRRSLQLENQEGIGYHGDSPTFQIVFAFCFRAACYHISSRFLFGLIIKEEEKGDGAVVVRVTHPN
jgi:hypothetical protein